MPFVVECACGQKREGQRQSRHQVVRCTRCGRSLFVLPVSPLPRLEPGPEVAALTAKPFLNIPPWILLPSTAAVLTLIGVVWFYALVLQSLAQQRAPMWEPGRTADQHEQAARQALAAREFARACAELEAAQALAGRDPSRPARERRRLSHLFRQATLLRHRLSTPLDQLLRDWERLTPEDLDKVFAGHRGRAVFFDLDVLRDATGRFQYRRRLGAELPRLDLASLTGLRHLPLGNRMQRLLFGARLAELRRGPQGEWVVGLEPDSAVLVTEEEVAAVVTVADRDLTETLERQAAWVHELAAEEVR